MQPRRDVPKSQHSYRFDELAVLVAVAEAGSLSAAAKQLGVPKSTVGRAIAAPATLRGEPSGTAHRWPA